MAKEGKWRPSLEKLFGTESCQNKVSMATISARAKVIKLTFVCSDFSATMIPKRQIGLLQIRRNARSATLQLKR